MSQRALIEKVKQDPKLMHALLIAQPIFYPVRTPWCIAGGALREACGWITPAKDIDILYFDSSGELSFSNPAYPNWEFTNQATLSGHPKNLEESLSRCILTTSTIGVWLDQGEVKVYECSPFGIHDLLDRIVRFNPMSGQTEEQFNKFYKDRNLTGVV